MAVMAYRLAARSYPFLRLSPRDYAQVFGIDCTGPHGDGILFKGGEWAPGGEYVQRLRVKNVSPKLKKLKYRLPTSKYFSMAYPQPMSLSPGTMQVGSAAKQVFLPASRRPQEEASHPEATWHVELNPNASVVVDKTYLCFVGQGCTAIAVYRGVARLKQSIPVAGGARLGQGSQ